MKGINYYEPYKAPCEGKEAYVWQHPEGRQKSVEDESLKGILRSGDQGELDES